MSKKYQWATIIALSGCLAIFSSFISANLHSRFEHHPEAVSNQFAILKGLPHHIDGQEKVFPQFQSRVLFPLLLKGLTETHLMSASQSFIFLRITTAFIGYLVFFIVCIQFEGMPVKHAALGAGVLAYTLVFTFNHGWEHPTDFLDVAFFSAFLGLALQRRPIVFALAVFLGTLNHQTAAFAGVIWFFLWGLDERELQLKWQGVAFSSGLVIGSYAVSTAVKFLFGGRGQSAGYVIDGWATIPEFIGFLRHPTPYGWPVLLVAMVVPVILWLWSNRAFVQGDLRRLVQASLCIVLLSSPVAFWTELRSVFLVPVLIATFAATVAEARMQRKFVAVSRTSDSASAGLSDEKGGRAGVSSFVKSAEKKR
jgi:hypothetical protein